MHIKFHFMCCFVFLISLKDCFYSLAEHIPNTLANVRSRNLTFTAEYVKYWIQCWPLHSFHLRVSPFTNNFSWNCIFQNLSIIPYVIFPSLKIGRIFSAPLSRLEETILAISLMMVLRMLFLLGTIQTFSSKEISPLVLKGDMGEAQCKPFSSPTHQQGLTTSHQMSKVHLPPSMWTRLHSLSGPTQSFLYGLSQIPRNCHYFFTSFV